MPTIQQRDSKACGNEQSKVKFARGAYVRLRQENTLTLCRKNKDSNIIRMHLFLMGKEINAQSEAEGEAYKVI